MFFRNTLRKPLFFTLAFATARRAKRRTSPTASASFASSASQYRDAPGLSLTFSWMNWVFFGEESKVVGTSQAFCMIRPAIAWGWGRGRAATLQTSEVGRRCQRSRDEESDKNRLDEEHAAVPWVMRYARNVFNAAAFVFNRRDVSRLLLEYCRFSKLCALSPCTEIISSPSLSSLE
jgi:hypothetical protein